MSNHYSSRVKEKPFGGELYIDLPKELMDKLNWKPGEELVWEETEVLGDKEDYLAAYVCRKVDWDKDIKPIMEKLK